ncbi:hypothetical protein [Palleronia pelagia]|uniref:Uncharacterized protein n=1 Tax=Palleronia pelagia TaxID=387096 RepID=A0A1H8GGL2_9RHOB|nr:hypothetical protein [Palleronia pelagia]SEN42884.1 hypothetical protein SAMN04488011_10464 [Palleronia pelagia]
MTRNAPAELSPIIVGAALLGTGMLLRRWQPSALSLPERPDTLHRDSGARRAARKTRDGIARVLPSNLTGSLGRTLIIAGAGLVLVRLLDFAVDDGEALFD